MLASQAQVRARIKLLTDSGTDPVLTDPGDIDYLVECASRVDLFGNIPNYLPEWVTGNGYHVGDQVVSVAQYGDAFIPLVRNGFIYQCTVAGNSGATQPAWPTTIGQTIVDGTATWSCAATAPWNPTYDINYAVSRGWELKSLRLVGNYNFMANGKMLSREQFYTHCVQMQKRFAARAGVRGINLGGHDPLALQLGQGMGVPNNADD